MAREDFRFVHTLRVRYNEIDGQRIVYNARYLDFTDIAQTEYFRSGISMHLFDLADAGEFDVATVHVDADYFQPFLLDDIVEIGVKCTAIGTTSITFVYEMWKQGKPDVRFRCTGVYVNFDHVTRGKRPVPDHLRAAIARFEGWERA
jgi:acyl-CoA thioester hydrolase